LNLEVSPNTGGFTVLMTLCTPETATVFAAGTSSYGVSDLALLAGDTHKFESQYLFKLVGGTPAEVPEVYAARSAVKHADQIRSPLLVSINRISGIIRNSLNLGNPYRSSKAPTIGLSHQTKLKQLSRKSKPITVK
jgi:hypothetical protein